jgi:hypothetical protein
LLDSLAGLFGGNHTAFIGGLRSLLQEAAGCRAYLNCRAVADKRIDALGLGHTFTVARIGVLRKRIVEESWRELAGRPHEGSIAAWLELLQFFDQPVDALAVIDLGQALLFGRGRQYLL